MQDCAVDGQREDQAGTVRLFNDSSRGMAAMTTESS